MRRRECITLLSGAAAWPIAVRAQQLLDVQFGRVPGLSPEVKAAIAEVATPIRAFSMAGNLLNMMAVSLEPPDGSAGQAEPDG